MPVEFKHRTLQNGLTVVAETDPTAHSSAVGFFVKTGARDETPQDMGVSHFLEHMMFKGTDKRTADEVNQAFDAIGASHNAYTSHEMTAFFATTLPEYADNAIEILSDMMRPALRQADFDGEKNVILEEIAMYRDYPFWTVYEAGTAAFYGDHALAHRVLGTDDTIKAMQLDAMKRYFNQRYSADNTTVALTGNIDFDAACDQLNQLCGHWTSTNPTRDAAEPNTHEGTLELTDSKVNRAYMLMLTPAPSAQDPRRYAAALLGRILGDPGNSRLHWALVETGLAEEAQAAYDPRDGCGQYYLYASGDPDKADDIWKVVLQTLDDLVDSLTQEDLIKLVSTYATSVTIAGERPGGRMQRLGRTWTTLGEYLPLEKELAEIQAVTLEDLRAVYNAYPFAPRMVTRLMPTPVTT